MASKAFFHLLQFENDRERESYRGIDGQRDLPTETKQRCEQENNHD